MSHGIGVVQETLGRKCGIEGMFCGTEGSGCDTKSSSGCSDGAGGGAGGLSGGNGKGQSGQMTKHMGRFSRVRAASIMCGGINAPSMPCCALGSFAQAVAV